MFYKLFILVILSLGSTTNGDEEAVVETVSDDIEELRNYISNDEDQTELEGRKGRLLYSYRQNPMIDIVLQTAAPNYVPKHPDDIFDFLRDSFPLPGGEFHLDLLELIFFSNPTFNHPKNDLKHFKLKTRFAKVLDR